MSKRKKTSAAIVDELRSQHDPALIRSGVRGKYAERYHRSKRTVVLAPDVAAAFPDAGSVNDALRLLLRVARQTVTATKS